LLECWSNEESNFKGTISRTPVPSLWRGSPNLARATEKGERSNVAQKYSEAPKMLSQASIQKGQHQKATLDKIDRINMISASPQRRKERRELLWTQMNTDEHGSPLEIRGRRLREKELSKPHLHFERVVKICGDLCKSVSQYSLRARRLSERS